MTFFEPRHTYQNIFYIDAFDTSFNTLVADCATFIRECRSDIYQELCLTYNQADAKTLSRSICNHYKKLARMDYNHSKILS